jgi:beta-galactosidase/beta-glucuronidase
VQYRLLFPRPSGFTVGADVVLRFGAVDWSAAVWLNGHLLVANHTGGYSEFHASVEGGLRESDNELIVVVYDPSELGAQPFGKQRAASIMAPGTHGNR